jgi:UDP-N-acetylglucosamine 2-epimerase (non-hydrolysing)
MNRRLTTQLASLHFAPTAANADNLLREGIAADSIYVTGNTVIDALLSTAARGVSYGDPALDGLDADPRRVLLVTAHRRESWGEPLAAVGRALRRVALAEADLLVVLPAHRNPAVREAVLPAVAGLDNVVITEPLPYGGFVRLLNRAHVVLTDSGGIQEEAPSLGKPVLVMRDNTERPEAIAAGTARLVGTDEERVAVAVTELFDNEKAYAEMANAVNPYGDGHAAERTLRAIAHFVGRGEAPAPFGGGEMAGKPAR